MAITQEDIFIGSYYRTQFGEVREVTGIVCSNVVYTPHRRTAASVVSLPSQDISLATLGLTVRRPREDRRQQQQADTSHPGPIR